MPDITLPIVDENTPVADAFEPMIRGGVSGIVARTPNGLRLLHYSKVRAAWETGLATVGEIQGYVDLKERTKGERIIESIVDYSVKVLSNFVLLHSSGGLDLSTYMAASPGYCCTGPDKHCYPPHKRGSSDNCVVPLCPGKLP